MQDGGPPQQAPGPNGSTPVLRSRVTVVGIPSVSIHNNRLVVGTSQTSSTRSYTPIKVLGNGSFGTVWLCDWHGTLPPGTPLSPMQCGASARPQYAGMRLVAVKRMRRRWEGGWDECQKLKELESLRAIPFHPNIIPLYDFFLLPDTRELYFVFESMEGNLYHLIKTRRGRLLAGGLVASIFRQITLGLEHVHSHGYFHRDMKPENVLVTTTGLFDYTPVSPVALPNAPKEKDVIAIIKLADFGLARETNSAPPYTEYVSTRWYRAPEVLLFSRDYSTPVDMWAFGTIMAELANLRPLFPGSAQMDQIAKINDLLGDPSDEYGYDMNGFLRGGGPWARGLRLADSVGYSFPRSEPKDEYFVSLFDKSVPRSLIHCIRDLLRYDPTKRLTSRQCLNHPYLQETLPRNNIPFPPGLQIYNTNHQILPTSPYVHGTQSSPSLVSPPQVVSSPYSHSAHNLHQPQRFPDASISHRTPYSIPAPQSQFVPPPLPVNAHNNIHRHPPNTWTDSQNDYPMDVTPSHNDGPPTIHQHVNVRTDDNHDSLMVQDADRHSEQSPDVAPSHGQSHRFKLGALSSTFGKKPSTWRLGGMFGGDRSHHHNALPPVDETSPAVSFPTRKRAQSNSDTHSVREQSPQRPVEPLTQDANKNKKEAQRLNREAELERHRLANKMYRDQARDVMLRRRQILQGTVDDIEWHPLPEERTEVVENAIVKQGKNPASGPVRRERDSSNVNMSAHSVGAASGKFAPPQPGGDNFLQPPYGHHQPPFSQHPERDREWRAPSERVAKVRRREFDDDHSMSSSDMQSMSRMSSTLSFATVDSDPGPSRTRHRPSMYNMSRRTSRSSLRTSFDDFPASSARSSHSYSLEGQLVHDFRTQASVTSNLSGNLSPPPLHALSLSPSMSPPLSPSPPWMQVQQQHKEDHFALAPSPPYISISPGFSPHQLPPPASPYGPPSSYGYPPNTGYTSKSGNSAINPIFKVVSYQWDSTVRAPPGSADSHQPYFPPPPLPLSPAIGDRLMSPNILPPFSQLEAAAGGEYPPLSPMMFTKPTEDT